MEPTVHLHMHRVKNFRTHTHKSSCQLFDFYCAPVDNCPVREKEPSKYQSCGGSTSRQSSSVDFFLKQRLIKPTVRREQTHCQFVL